MPIPTFIDSHCHLDYPEFAVDFPEVLARARAVGVEAFLTISTRLSTFPAVRAVAERDEIYCTVGVHPHHAEEEADTTADTLCALAEHDAKVIGFGETGLDYYYEHSNRAVQQQVFRAHLTAAQRLQYPVIVHSRDAEEDTLRLLREAYAQKPYPGLIHCFTASTAFAEAVLALGFYISISGIVTFKTATALQETVRGVPLERLLIETDAPYLAPIPYRGKRNEPSFVVHTAEAVARLKGATTEEVAAHTTANFQRLFGVG